MYACVHVYKQAFFFTCFTIATADEYFAVKSSNTESSTLHKETLQTVNEKPLTRYVRSNGCGLHQDEREKLYLDWEKKTAFCKPKLDAVRLIISYSLHFCNLGFPVSYTHLTLPTRRTV